MEHLSPAIRWGRENEAKARKCYLEGSQADGEDIVAGLQPTGLHLLPEKAFWEPLQMGRYVTVWTPAAMGALK